MKIAIISFAHTHAVSYASILRDRDDIDLLTTDTAPVGDELRGRSLAESLGVPYVDTVDELFDWRPDAVIVCSESERHLIDVRRAAENGAHILCEKPIATSVEVAAEIVDICERAGVWLMTAFPVRFANGFRALRDVVDSGALGTVMTVTGTNNGKLPIGRAWFKDPLLAGGGAIVDHTVHVADLIFALFPNESVTEVFAAANNMLHTDLEVESAGLVSICYSNGVTALIDCSWSRPEHYPTWGNLTMQLVGVEGSAEISPFDSAVTGYSEERRESLWIDFGSNLDAAMLDEFISALSEDRQPIPSGIDGYRCVEIVSAAYESLRTGAPVSVAPAVMATIQTR